MNLLGATAVPADEGVRQRIREDFETTFLVEAGAGTGKTSALVDRIAGLVEAGRLKPPELVAITFTEAAAAELRARVRQRLQESPVEAAQEAAAGLEAASISTIHAFAAALLRTYPLEAELPPSFDTLDQIEQDLEFRERFRAWFDAAADDPQASVALKNALLLGLNPDRLEGLARALHENHDLLGPESTWPAAPPGSALPRAELLARRLQGLEQYLPDCLDPEDRMYAKLQELLFAAGRLERADSEGRALVALRVFDDLTVKVGNRDNWTNGSLYEIRDQLTEIQAIARSLLDGKRSQVLNSVLKALRDFVLAYAKERKRRGVATFHDQLTWARDLLRDQAEVRARAQRRWSRIFIDEFQDTDPLQAEIAFYLAAEPQQPETRHWLDLRLVPGKLFVVGDPKQSIYRFRRADIALYQEVEKRIARQGQRLALQQNFRSLPPVIDWVNAHFRAVMGFQEGIQPEYLALVSSPRAAGGAAGGGSVAYFGREAERGTRQSEIWRREAEDVARACRVAVAERWRVRDAKTQEERRAEWKDICVLIPTRTNLRRLERAFESWGVPYRLESGELIVMTQEVRELVSCLRAIDDPSDQVALVAALRSPAYACSDEELAEWRDQSGRFSYEAPGDGPTGRVREALDDLRDLHRLRHDVSVPALVEHFIDRRMLAAAAFGRPRPAETLRRLRYVAKRARDFAATGRATLRAFVEWMEGLEREQFRDTGSSTADADENAVRVLTIHGAKGLEFPIVVMTGWGSSRRGDRTQVLPDRIGNSLQVSGGEHWQTPGYQRAAEREKLADQAEAVRLTYVAATRARDHLVLSLHRREQWSNDPPSQAAGFAQTSDESGLAAPLVLDALTPPAAEAPKLLPQPSPEEQAAEELAWEQRRSRLLETLGGQRVTSATRLADTEPEVDAVAAQRRGRAGTSLGRAVHAVLQLLELATLAGLPELAAAQAAVEGIASRAGEVEELARRAAESTPVRAAIRAGRFWREVPLAAELEGTILEGFADLVCEVAGQLRVVDYKTDRVAAAEIEHRFEHYRLQAAVYALLLEKVTGKPVAGVDFVFVQPAAVRSLGGAELAAAVTELRLRLAEGLAFAEEGEGGHAGGGEGEPEGKPLAAGDTGADEGGEEQRLEPAEDQLGLPL